MYPTHPAHDPHPDSDGTDTGIDQPGNTLCEVDAIRAALHVLVDDLAPAELHALWDVLLVCSKDEGGATCAPRRLGERSGTTAYWQWGERR
jgi:hypothetical protein